MTPWRGVAVVVLVVLGFGLWTAAPHVRDWWTDRQERQAEAARLVAVRDATPRMVGYALPAPVTSTDSFGARCIHALCFAGTTTLTPDEAIELIEPTLVARGLVVRDGATVGPCTDKGQRYQRCTYEIHLGDAQVGSIRADLDHHLFTELGVPTTVSVALASDWTGSYGTQGVPAAVPDLGDLDLLPPSIDPEVRCVERADGECHALRVVARIDAPVQDAWHTLGRFAVAQGRTPGGDCGDEDCALGVRLRTAEATNTWARLRLTPSGSGTRVVMVLTAERTVELPPPPS